MTEQQPPQVEETQEVTQADVGSLSEVIGTSEPEEKDPVDYDPAIDTGKEEKDGTDPRPDVLDEHVDTSSLPEEDTSDHDGDADSDDGSGDDDPGVAFDDKPFEVSSGD